jgi:hypothetical protein
MINLACGYSRCVRIAMVGVGRLIAVPLGALFYLRNHKLVASGWLNPKQQRSPFQSLLCIRRCDNPNVFNVLA